MDAFKRALEHRDLRWKLFGDIRAKTGEKTERAIATLVIEVLDNSLSNLLSSKFVTSEWKGILGENGILNTLDKKIEMAVALGLLSTLDMRLLQQMGDIKRIFNLSAKEDLSFEDEPVRILCERLVLPESTYLPRKVMDMSEPNVVIKWNPMGHAKNARARFMYAFEYLYIDLDNRSTYFDGEAPESVEEVTLSMVLARQEARYQEFLNAISQREAEVELEWKVITQMEKLFEEKLFDGILDVPPATIQWNLIQEKREANREALERLQKQILELKELKKETKWTWQTHQNNFSVIVEQAEKTRAKKERLERELKEQQEREKNLT